MEHLISAPVDWVGKEYIGFVINAAFSQENGQMIKVWLDGLNAISSEGVYTMPPKGLHITVLDWVAPLFDYDSVDKRDLFRGLRLDYDMAFRTIADSMEPFDVQFDMLRVTPGTVILTGHDAGQFGSLRHQFMSSITLPEGGKSPPDIIHASLARFVMPEIALSPIQAYVAENPLNFTQRISEFRLIETRREPMQDYSVLDAYKLGVG